MVGALVTLACMPTLLLNVGIGRSVLLHEHQDSFHGHVLASVHHHHHHHGDHGHAHHHDPVGHHGDDEDAVPPLVPDAVIHPVEGHEDGAVIRGAAVVTAKRQNPATEVAAATLHAVPLVWTTPAAPPTAPPVRAGDPVFGTGRTQLDSLRVVVLLI